MPSVRAIRPGRAVVVATSVCGLLTLGALFLLPFVDPEDTELAGIVLDPGEARWWLLLGVCAVQVLFLLGARQWPREVVAALVVLSALTVWTSPDPGLSLWTPTFAVAIVALFLAEPPRRSLPTIVVGAAVVSAAIVVALVARDAATGGTLLLALAQPATVAGAAVAVAALLRARRDLRESQEREREATLQRREAQLRAAVSEERAAMARELHDIAAHHLSGMALTTAAIQRLVDTDPERAKSAAGEVREQTKVLLGNLRRLVGLLREDGPGETGPTPALGDVPALVAGVAAAGTAVELTIRRPDGVAVAGRRVGPLAQLAAYRMVQESLANVARHAPGAACTVVVDDRDPRTLSIAVENGPPEHGAAPAPGGGFGLVGMRERADLTGSTLDFGPRADGGWRVSLAVPRDDEPRNDGGPFDVVPHHDDTEGAPR